MKKVRKAYVVYVDLDPMPGSMHTQESAQNIVREALRQRLQAYNPTVSLAPAEMQPSTGEAPYERARD